MTITEKVAYLKGLMEGLELDTSSKEGKVLKAVVDVLDDMALSVTDIEDDLAELSDQVDEIDGDLSEVEDEVFGDEDECCDDDDDCDCCDGGDDDDFYEVTCSKCGETTYITGAILDEGKMECPNCGEELEFDVVVDEDEDENGDADSDHCGCGCDCGCGDKADK